MHNIKIFYTIHPYKQKINNQIEKVRKLIPSIAKLNLNKCGKLITQNRIFVNCMYEEYKICVI